MARDRPLVAGDAGRPGLETGEHPVSVPALGSVRVCGLDFTRTVSTAPATPLGTGNRRDLVLVYELWREGRRLSLGLVPFVPSKHLALADPQFRTAVEETAGGFEIEVTAGRLARFVWLALEEADVIFSDNYFDLPAGRTVDVRLPALDGWHAERVRRALRVRSLFDSY